MKCNKICASGENCFAERIEDNISGRFDEWDVIEELSSTFEERFKEFLAINHDLPSGEDIEEIKDDSDPLLIKDLECLETFVWAELECQNSLVSNTGRLAIITELQSAFEGETKVIDIPNNERIFNKGELIK